MNKRYFTKVIAGLAVGLFMVHAVAFQGCAGDPPRIDGVIYYSTAPWDGPAYEIVIPLKSGPDSSTSAIRIDLWGNPEFPELKSLTFSRDGGPNEGGRATFQAALNASLPVSLAGTVSFRALRKGNPVDGAFSFSSPDGEVFAASFRAAWGNTPPPYIR